MRNPSLHFPYLPKRIHRLGDLAYNLWFSWNREALELFKLLDEKLWKDTEHNPVRLLHEIDPDRLDQMAQDNDFLESYDNVVQEFDFYLDDSNTWYRRNYPDLSRRAIAYFSMEFGFHESLPIYSGGLGILAGDHLKTASDMGIPMVGVGLVYRESYFTQLISLHGNQQVIYRPNDFSTMALELMSNGEGKPLVVRVELNHFTASVRVWKLRVGRVPLYLLDTDFPMNPEPVREITHRLYVDDRDNRLVQELLLGIGGVRVLDALGIEPAVWHMNEGHSAFLGLERMRRLVETGKELNQAREDVRSTTVFTTHTPVPAGNEVFPAELIGHYLNRDGEYKKIPADSVYRLARSNPDGSGEFNMTVLALNLSDYRNGVSRLHGEVARDMWKHLWPDRPVNEVPIGAITNGVHTHTWLTRQVLQLFDRTIGRDWRDHIVEPLFWEKIADIPDEELWQVHQELKNRFLETIRKRLVVQRERNGESRQAIIEALKFGDPEVLTIGFARRFAPYKRGTLLFRDREKLIKLVSDSRRPVQILFAGKAHPANEDGKALIRQIYAESRNPDFQSRIAFLENYDIRLARRMVSGVDIWLNTPRRPMEASGTSGMKAALNGALNLSISDGWWPEGYDGTNGWVIGEEKTYANTEEQDEADAKSLYKILGEEIIPLYYHRDDRGIPGKWMQRMKRSMATLIPRFNTYRMLESYVKNMYYPAAGKTGA